MPQNPNAPKSVLLVCLGNICRSPTAEEILRQKAAVAGLSLKVDSAGTGNWHVGKHPDDRSCKHAKRYGYNINKLVARQVSEQDFYDFELILAMDNSNLEHLQAMRTHLLDELSANTKHSDLPENSDQHAQVSESQQHNAGNADTAVSNNHSTHSHIDSEIARLALFSSEDPIYAGEDIPDPYYGGDDGFEQVIQRIESAADAWIESWIN